MKRCNSCGVVKKLDQFGMNNGYKRYECKTCHSARNNKYNKTRKDKTKSNKLLFDYGITLEQYNKMFEYQNGCCAICNAHQLELNRSLDVDHCHKMGYVRGLLCSVCNLQVGMYESNRLISFNETYERIAAYVLAEGVDYPLDN